MLNRILISVLAVEILSVTAVVWAENDRPTSAPKKQVRKDGGHKKGPMDWGISKEEEQKLLKLLKDKRPAQYERLTKLKKTDERRYRWAIRSLAHWHRRLAEMPEKVRNAEITRHDTRLKIWKLAREIRKTSDADRKASLTGELRKATETMFNADQVIHEYHLKQLEQRVKELRAELKAHSEQRNEIIDQRVKDYLKGRVRKSQRHPPRPGERPGM